jgi:hypothetical protein
MTDRSSSNASPPDAESERTEETTERRRWPRCLAVLLGVLVLIAGAGVALWQWWGGPDISEEKVRRTVVSTIQKETPASFLVTGQLQTTATATVRNTKVFLPGTLDMSLGTTTSEVRLPGTASYGFDVRSLSSSDIRVGKNGVVEVHLPDLAVHGVDAKLGEMEIKTETGWARLPKSRNHVQQDAMGVAEKALRRQAEDHLKRSTQPRVNTARALRKMLRPALKSAGVADPRFRIRVGPEIVLEPQG